MTQPTPFFETANPVPYVGVVSTIPMTDLSDADSGFGQLFSWLEIQGIEPAGPSFYRYKEFKNNGLITLEVGLPADVPDTVDTEFIKGVIPGGRYLSLLHTGDYSGLQAATQFLLKWAEDHELKFQTREENDVSLWTARLEWYLVDPTLEPDPAEWQTKISILLE